MVSKFDTIKSRVTSAIMPPKYVLSAKVGDLSVHRLLEKAIDDDGCLSYQEIHDLVAAVVGDGQVTPQELRDMQAIATHSKSLQGPGKIYLQAFLANPQAFIDHNRKATEGSSGGQRADKQRFERSDSAEQCWPESDTTGEHRILSSSSASKRKVADIVRSRQTLSKRVDEVAPQLRRDIERFLCRSGTRQRRFDLVSRRLN